MDHRERVWRAINFQKPDRVPFNFWMDRRRMNGLEEKYGADFRIRHYGADVMEAFVGLAWPAGTFEEKLGTSWMIKPLIEDWREAKNIKLPDPTDPAVYEPLKAVLKANPDVAVLLDFPNVLTWTECMLKQEQLYMDIHDYYDEIQAFWTRMSEIMVHAADVACKLDITALYVMDDVGSNKGLIISPKLWKQAVYPHWKKVIDVAHAHNKPVFFHTDGNVQQLWEEFLNLGVRMLNPLQPDLQPLEVFKKQYHGKMGIYGGLPTDKLHLLSPDDIRFTVQDLFQKAGAEGGLIMSTHDIDHSISDEQLEAMVSAIKDCRY